MRSQAAMLGILLRPGRIVLQRFLSLGENEGRARVILGGLLTLGVSALVFYLTFRALRFFSGVEVIGILLTSRLLEFSLLGVLSFVFLSSLVTALGTFFLADDLLLLRAAPVPEGAFFLARWLQTGILSCWMVLGFSIPLLGAYGAALGGGWLYGVSIVLALIPLVLIPTAVGIMLILILVCVFPARRVRDLFVVLGVVSAALLLLLFRVAQPERLMRPEVFGSVANYVAAFEIPQNALLPSSWAAAALAAAQVGRFDWASLGLLWSALWGMGSIAFLIHRRWYPIAYSRAQEGGPGEYGGSAGIEQVMDRFNRGLPQVTRAFARKDVRLFVRDPGQWSQLLLLLTLIIAYVYNYAVFPGGQLQLAGIQVNLLLGVMNLVLAGFVLSALVARFAFPAVSIEGRAFWLVRTAPISVRQFLAVKLRLALLPLLPLTVILVGITAYWIELPVELIAMSLLHIVTATLVLVTTGVSLGAIFPRFKFENPAQIPMSFGGILFMLVATLYTIAAAMATAWLAAPIAIPALHRSPEITLFSWALWLTFQILHAIIPLRLASRSLAQKEFA